jgi:SAM-dependent methyltransferase
VNEDMVAEFDTVAEWTADVAADLGRDHYVPAGCRGSASPAGLRWLLDHLGVDAADRMLDCGAGVGGPSAFASSERGIRPILVEPELGACRAAGRLFDLPVLAGSADALPLATETFDVAWSLGVMCTMHDQLTLLTELRRVVVAPSRIGLLVYVARTASLSEQPKGNNFPQHEDLLALIGAAGLRVEAWTNLSALPDEPQAWRDRQDEIAAEMDRRHGDDREWQIAQEQSAVFGRLLSAGELGGELLSLRASGAE